ncbi:MAG: stage II sporulation protein M [Chitinophagaceae bacterium]|nr:stage II sporulation protein M [Chitinophagaceae bacterium]
MREGLFLKKNIEKWKGYQYESSSDPDEMAHEFTELVNDLGYAKTFYPQSAVTQYLNGLASKIYLGIYKNKREDRSRLITFWTTELPLLVRRYHRELLYSFLIFTVFALMAAFSSAQDQTFVRGVLGDGYVEMTEDNIAKGDPFGVYKSMEPVTMFFTIALNNIKVSFMVFIGGMLASAGTIWMLFENGMMLGSFQTFFFMKNLGWQSVLTVWIHGTLEISAIIISGGAGFILGNSILFPKTHRRLDSLKRSARDGMKLMIGLVPIFIAAAFLEGFITRYSSMPRPISISILLLSLSFIVWYFIIFPIKVTRRVKSKMLLKTQTTQE